MKGVWVTFIAKIEGVVNEKFSGAPPQTPTFFAPPINIPGGATGLNKVHRRLLKFPENRSLLIKLKISFHKWRFVYA